MPWTKEQQQAIDNRHVNAIVSAGAGSGKTAVLKERTFNIIKNGEAKVDELLILTFTNSAAREMKERIIDSLRQNELYALADQVESSNVTTFDAYFLYLVKKYNYFFNISKDVTIIDKNIVNIKAHEILDKIFDKLYENNDEEFRMLIKTFVVKKDDTLKEYILSILEQADLKVDKYGFLNSRCEEVFTSNYQEALLELVMEKAKEQVREASIAIEYLENEKIINKLEDRFARILEANDYNSFYEAYNFSLSKSKAKNAIESDNQIISYIAKTINLKKIKSMGNKESILELINNPQYKNAYQCLFNIALELDKQLEEFKKEKNSYTFFDIAKMALSLVQDEEINQELKQSIKFIMVDEYQDTSDIQEAFISAIANNNLFMVGDTKQSIYSFRNANCDIFQGKYEKYKIGDGGEKIDLNANFRSRSEIVEDLNTMFSLMMSKKIGSVDYRFDHIAIAGNKVYDTKGKTLQNNHIELYKYIPSGSSRTKDELEAHLIAQDIVKKINEGYEVLDKKSGVLRKCYFSDFAILCDKKKKFDLVKKVFEDYQIPLKVYKKKKAINSLVGNMFYDALSVVNKIHKEEFDVEFKHALVGLMRSFAYQFKDPEIYRYVKEDKLNETLPFLDMQKIALLVKDLPISEIVLKIYDCLDIYNKLVTVGDVEENEIVLNKLYEVAKTMQNLDYSLEEFLQYVNNMKKFESDMEYDAEDSIDNVVKIMSIHQSKGLEFGIVYMPYIESDFFKTGSENTSFKTSNEYGLIMPIVGRDSDDSLSILKYLNDDIVHSKTLSERLRLFYVALTRAREKAIILFDEEKDRTIYSLSEANSFYDFVNFYQEHSNTKMIERAVEFNECHLNNFKEEQVKDSVEFSFNKYIAINPQKEKVRASKVASDYVDNSALEFGSELHYLLELVNLKTKDVSFIKDNYKKHLITNVLKLDIFKDLDETQIFKEYSFYDEDTDLNGIIDLLLIKEKEIAIIDYKTKNIDDEAYNRQLNIYKDYIIKTFNMPVKTYLLSIVDADIKEVY